MERNPFDLHPITVPAGRAYARPTFDHDALLIAPGVTTVPSWVGWRTFNGPGPSRPQGEYQ